MGANFLKALLFGAVLAGSIGPIALLIFGTAARRGFPAGLYAGLGAALADLLYAAVAFSAGALLLPLLAAHERPIRIGCALLLVALGCAMLLRYRPETEAPSAAGSALWPTFLLTLVNPMTVVVFAGFMPQLPVAGSPPVAAWLAFALSLGSFAVSGAIAAAGAAAGVALPGSGWRRAINAASAFGIIGFGIAGLAGA
jgi:threonine/homoserine/homoserine lactone efflux protein